MVKLNLSRSAAALAREADEDAPCLTCGDPRFRTRGRGRWSCATIATRRSTSGACAPRASDGRGDCGGAPTAKQLPRALHKNGRTEERTEASGS